MTRLDEIKRRDAETETWLIADRRWLLETVAIQDRMFNINEIAHKSSRRRIETLEEDLRNIIEFLRSKCIGCGPDNDRQRWAMIESYSAVCTKESDYVPGSNPGPGVGPGNVGGSRLGDLTVSPSDIVDEHGK